MEPGSSEQAKQLRRYLLNHNAPDLMKRMQQSGMADPVGMIVEMTDEIGKQLNFAALEKQGTPRHEIPELIASYCKNAIPTFKCFVSFETEKKILPITSETALQNLSAPRKPDVHWIDRGSWRRREQLRPSAGKITAYYLIGRYLPSGSWQKCCALRSTAMLVLDAVA